MSLSSSSSSSSPASPSASPPRPTRRPGKAFPGNIKSILLGGHNTDTGVNNIQYTAQFGNGVSGTIGLDDPSCWNRTNVYNLASGSMRR